MKPLNIFLLCITAFIIHIINEKIMPLIVIFTLILFACYIAVICFGIIFGLCSLIFITFIMAIIHIIFHISIVIEYYTQDRINNNPIPIRHHPINNQQELEFTDIPPDDVCAICMEKPQPDDLWNILKCHHKFHHYCIDLWIKRVMQCPLCRYKIRT